MQGNEFRECLVAYHEEGNDYRYVLSREQAQDIEDALNIYNKIKSFNSWEEIIKFVASIWEVNDD